MPEELRIPDVTSSQYNLSLEARASLRLLSVVLPNYSASNQQPQWLTSPTFKWWFEEAQNLPSIAINHWIHDNNKRLRAQGLVGSCCTGTVNIIRFLGGNRLNYSGWKAPSLKRQTFFFSLRRCPTFEIAQYGPYYVTVLYRQNGGRLPGLFV